MPKIKPQDCHYYESSSEDFIDCPVVLSKETPQGGSVCMVCYYYRHLEIFETQTKINDTPKLILILCDNTRCLWNEKNECKRGGLIRIGENGCCKNFEGVLKHKE